MYYYPAFVRSGNKKKFIIDSSSLERLNVKLEEKLSKIFVIANKLKKVELYCDYMDNAYAI